MAVQGMLSAPDNTFAMDGLEQSSPPEELPLPTKSSSSKGLFPKPSARASPKPPQVPRTILTLANALKVYGLTKHELFWETKLDTRCLIGWNGCTMVIAFRGTASMKNAMTDIQVRAYLQYMVPSMQPGDCQMMGS